MQENDYVKGEYIVYGSSGICLIEDVRLFSFSIASPQTEHYILRPLNSKNSVLYVPVGNELLKKKMRPVLTKEEIDSILKNAIGKEIEWIEDRKLRAAAFKEILASGDRRELILLIRCIYLHGKELQENGKKISSSDNDTLQTAERMVREEFTFSLGISPLAVEQYIANVLD